MSGHPFYIVEKALADEYLNKKKKEELIMTKKFLTVTLVLVLVAGFMAMAPKIF